MPRKTVPPPDIAPARQLSARPEPQPEPIDSDCEELPTEAEAGASPPQQHPTSAESGSSGMPAQETPEIFHAGEEDSGMRLDHYLVSRLPDVSRVRVQQLIEQGKVLVNQRAAKASLKLKGSEQIEITGPVEVAPLKAFAEDIPLGV